MFTRAGTEAELYYIISSETVFDIQNNKCAASFYKHEAWSHALREKHKSMYLKIKCSGKYPELTRMK